MLKNHHRQTDSLHPVEAQKHSQTRGIFNRLVQHNPWGLN